MFFWNPNLQFLSTTNFTLFIKRLEKLHASNALTEKNRSKEKRSTKHWRCLMQEIIPPNFRTSLQKWKIYRNQWNLNSNSNLESQFLKFCSSSSRSSWIFSIIMASYGLPFALLSHYCSYVFVFCNFLS